MAPFFIVLIMKKLIRLATLSYSVIFQKESSGRVLNTPLDLRLRFTKVDTEAFMV